MQKNKTYFVKTEDEDAFKFEKLAYQTGWWKNIKRAEYAADYDYEGTLIDNRHTIIELKTREMNADKYEEYFIEADKLADCYIHATMSNSTPLYINFFNDGQTLIWNLQQLDTPPVKEKVRRANKGFDTMEVNNVYKLAASDAYKYQLII